MARLGTFSKDFIQNGAFDETIQPDGIYDYTFENFVIIGFPIVPIIKKIESFLQLTCNTTSFNELSISSVTTLV